MTIKTAYLLFFSILFSFPALAQHKKDPPPYNFLTTPSEVDGAYKIIPGFLETNVETSKKIIERQENVHDKAIVILKAREDGKYEPYRLHLGARVVGTYIAEKTNIDGKFPILSRLPPTHTSGDSDSYGVVNDFTSHATLTLPWVTGFIQGEYTETEYPGQDRWQLRKGYVILGDLEKFPVYAAIGKKSVNFGDFSSYAPFTHTHSAHYFWAQTDEPLLEVGYVTDKTMIAASLIKNDRGLRVLNSPENDDEYENFAFNASHKFTLDDNGDIQLKIGAGFLRGSIYDSTLAHHPPGIGIDDRFWNSLINANAELNLHDFDFMIEFTQTAEDWPATDSHVKALTVQGRYNDTILSRPVKYTLSYSRGEQGDPRDEWESMDQGIAGIEWDIHPHISIGAEYMVNHGFVPLILPKFTADDGVVSHTGIVGAKISF
jgi:opacity protein-like surface antigen